MKRTTEKKSRSAEALRLMGLARRAGCVVPGADAVRRSIRSGEARLVVMAGDASSAQLDKIRKALKDRPIPQATLGDRALLGGAVGRGPISALAVTADSFVGRIRELLDPVDEPVVHVVEE